MWTWRFWLGIWLLLFVSPCSSLFCVIYEHWRLVKIALNRAALYAHGSHLFCLFRSFYQGRMLTHSSLSPSLSVFPSLTLPNNSLLFAIAKETPAPRPHTVTHLHIHTPIHTHLPTYFGRESFELVSTKLLYLSKEGGLVVKMGYWSCRFWKKVGKVKININILSPVFLLT